MHDYHLSPALFMNLLKFMFSEFLKFMYFLCSGEFKKKNSSVARGFKNLNITTENQKNYHIVTK